MGLSGCQCGFDRWERNARGERSVRGDRDRGLLRKRLDDVVALRGLLESNRAMVRAITVLEMGLVGGAFRCHV